MDAGTCQPALIPIANDTANGSPWTPWASFVDLCCLRSLLFSSPFLSPRRRPFIQRPLFRTDGRAGSKQLQDFADEVK